MAIFSAFLDGITGTGLFGKRLWPGAPTELIDSRPTEAFDAKAAAIKLQAQRAKQSETTNTFPARTIKLTPVEQRTGKQ